MVSFKWGNERYRGVVYAMVWNDPFTIYGQASEVHRRDQPSGGHGYESVAVFAERLALQLLIIIFGFGAVVVLAWNRPMNVFAEGSKSKGRGVGPDAQYA